MTFLNLHIKMLILEERFKWHLDAFTYKLFKYKYYMKNVDLATNWKLKN